MPSRKSTAVSSLVLFVFCPTEPFLLLLGDELMTLNSGKKEKKKLIMMRGLGETGRSWAFLMYYRGRGLSDQRPIQYGPDRPRAPSPTTKRVDAHARTKYTSRFPPLTRSKAAAAAAARRPDPAGLVEEQDGIADERRRRARHVRFVPPLPIPLPLPLPLRRVVPCIPRSPNPRAQFLGRTARFGSNHVSRGEFERLVPWGARLGGSRFRTQPARGVGGRSDSLIFPSPPRGDGGSGGDATVGVWIC